MTSGADPNASPRLDAVLAAQRRWRDAGVHLAGIRHHSPGCARALAALLDDVRPATVLIEGPREYRALLGVLGDPRTRPPVAVLSTHDSGAAFYPLADFSPEWIALRWGLAHDATVDFIDASYAVQQQDDDPGLRTLQTENHLARSESLARLAEQLGCRDHDELWEHLFEVRTEEQARDWTGFFDDTLAWAALARMDAGRELLDGDGTLAREAVMTAVVDRYRDTGRAPIVVVTGAFHTTALLDWLEQTPRADWLRAHPPGDLDAPRPAWLIRYDFTRMDGLRGYGAGMPSPGFWQRAWQARAAGTGPREFTAAVLLEIAGRLRETGHPLGTATVMDAATCALNLAGLRERPWPGRTDVADAVLSCFVKDDQGLSGTLGEVLAEVFGGSRLGELPDGLASPPLVAEARDRARALRFSVDDARPRRTSLDTQRKPAHRARREFLARMRFAGSGFARQTGGADLVGGTGAALLFEEWEYCWTPMVETALIEASGHGPTLSAVVGARIAERLAEPGHADGVARLLVELIVMGESDHLPAALASLRSCYDTDPQLGSVVASLHALTRLLSAGGRLALGDQGPAVADLLGSGLAAAAYQVGPLAGVEESELAATATTLISLRSLLVRVGELAASGELPALPPAVDGVTRELRVLRLGPQTPARLRGVLIGLGYSDGELSGGELSQAVAAHLRAGADSRQVAGFLQGLLQAAPDLLLHTPELVSAVNDAVTALAGEDFLGVLPDLRQAFTWLKPAETHRLATAVAALVGANAADLDAVWQLDPGLAATAAAIEKDLVAGLIRDGLSDWTSS